MKVILLIALFGISFCYGEDSCTVPTATNPNDGDCLIKALQTSPKFLEAVSHFLCEYKAYKDGGNEDNLNNAASQLVFILKCVGCSLTNTVSDLEYASLEKLIEGLGKGGTEAAKIIEKILNELKISDLLAKNLCELTKSLLTDPCVKEALGKLSVELITKLKNLYCKGDDLSAEEAAEVIKIILEKLGCTLDSFLKDTNQTLENFMASLGDTAKPVAKTLLLTLKNLGVINDLACNLVGGTGGLTVLGTGK